MFEDIILSKFLIFLTFVALFPFNFVVFQHVCVDGTPKTTKLEIITEKCLIKSIIKKTCLFAFSHFYTFDYLERYGEIYIAADFLVILV